MSENSEYSEDFEGQQNEDFSGDKEYLNSRGNSEAKNSETEVKTYKTPESRKKTPMGKFSEVNTSKFIPIDEDNTKPPKYPKMNQSKDLNESEKTKEDYQYNQKTDREPQIILEQQEKQSTFKYNQENSRNKNEEESSQEQQKKRKVENDYQTYEKQQNKTQDKREGQKNILSAE